MNQATAMLLAAATVLALARPAAAETFKSTYRSVEWGVELTVPRGWELSDQRSYPGVIARAFDHKGGGRLLLTAERASPGETARSYVERSQKSLIKLGYRIAAVAQREGGAIIVDSTAPDRKRVLRQAYVVKERVAYVLTVSAKADAAKGGRPFEAFDETMRSLVINPPPEPETGAAPAPESQ
jgi:hypothetical protein